MTEVVAALESHFVLEVRGRLPPDLRRSEHRATAELTGWSPPTELEQGVAQLAARRELKLGTVSAAPPSLAVSTLVTSLSAGAHVPCSRRCVTGHRGTVWGGDIDPQAVARFEVDEFWEMPTAKIDAGLAGKRCRDQAADSDPGRELDYAAPLAFAGAGVFIPIGSEASVAANDKLAFAEALIEAGISAIPTSGRLDANAADQLVVKERYGAGGATIAIDVSHGTGCRQGHVEPVFQPFAGGIEFGVDLYDQAGECLEVLVEAVAGSAR